MHTKAQPSNLELTQQLFAALGEKEKLPAFLAQWAEDGVTFTYPGATPIPYAGTWRGRDGFVKFFGMISQHVRFKSMAPSSFVAVGDQIFIQGLTNGTVLATGKTYVSPWFMICTFRNGKLADMVEYHDTQAIANAFV